jgi:hydroxymethylpyrimidine/phosphomethylpyrimidine kinase
MEVTVPPRILVIAGSDSSGGAGIQADIKTITMLGGYAMTAVTAVTAQNTTGVQAVLSLSENLVAEQILSCERDIGFDAIKIGMLGSASNAERVWELLLGQPQGMPIVFDPVMVATSGSSLADSRMFAPFYRLMELATLTTPNVAELAELGGHEGMRARGIAYLAKGGDAEGPEVEDVLVRPGEEDRLWRSPRIATRHTHGTGCTLSSAIATLLGKGMTLEQAIADAREFVREALLAAPGFGAGYGPMGHYAVR